MKRFLKRSLARLHYELTGLHPNALKGSVDNYAGTISALLTLSPKSEAVEPIALSEAFEDLSQSKDCKDLAALFAQHGSDKSTVHNYYLMYAAILKGKRDLPLNILEIGLGTNNTSLPSNMGKDGKPGASLRTWRDWAPKSTVFGADIDMNILFSEERITTHYVDQTDPSSLKTLAEQLHGTNFDLIVDDGLHNPWANLNTLHFALDLLKPGAVFVVEDILKEYLPIWKIAVTLIDPKYHPLLVNTKCRTVCVLRKPEITVDSSRD